MNILSKLKASKPSFGALWVVAALLVASAGIRVAIGTDSAIALESEDMPMEAAATEMMTCEPPPEEISVVLEALNNRHAAIEAREAALEDRIAALSLAEQEIQENLEALEKAEKMLAATIATASTAAEDDLSKLTTVYENMKPKEASALFEQMAPDFAAGFLGRMRPDAAAGIMAGLTSGHAYSISVILAGRNANVPSE